MIYLSEVIRIKSDEYSEYPFHMNTINQLETLRFDSPVTFLIGENGCGKTTFLESVVHLSGVINILPGDQIKMHGSKMLSKSFKTIWHKKTSKGFYLKSQSFVNFIDSIEKMKRETSNDLETLKKEFENRSEYALDLASGPYNKTLHALKHRYGKGLEKMSHGEGYIEMFKSRLVPDGLYILDEPEFSLSPMRQLSLISLINEMVKKNCQFIIITHSPILMSIKGSTILDFNDKIEKIDYQDVEHVNLTRDFLNNPERYLKYL